MAVQYTMRQGNSHYNDIASAEIRALAAYVITRGPNNLRPVLNELVYRLSNGETVTITIESE